MTVQPKAQPKRGGFASDQAGGRIDVDCADKRHGVRWTIDGLYRSQSSRLMRLFRRRSDPQDASDLLHETFARFAHATLEREVAPDCPESYLTQVAVNVMRDRGSSAAYRASLQSVELEDAQLVAPDDEAAIIARDMLRRVEAVMLELKPVTRHIFIARRFHGYSRAEIAAQAGISVKAVDKHLGRAVEHLYRHFGNCDDF